MPRTVKYSPVTAQQLVNYPWRNHASLYEWCRAIYNESSVQRLVVLRQTWPSRLLEPNMVCVVKLARPDVEQFWRRTCHLCWWLILLPVFFPELTLTHTTSFCLSYQRKWCAPPLAWCVTCITFAKVAVNLLVTIHCGSPPAPNPDLHTEASGFCGGRSPIQVLTLSLVAILRWSPTSPPKLQGNCWILCPVPKDGNSVFDGEKLLE